MQVKPVRCVSWAAFYKINIKIPLWRRSVQSEGVSEQDVPIRRRVSRPNDNQIKNDEYLVVGFLKRPLETSTRGNLTLHRRISNRMPLWVVVGGRIEVLGSDRWTGTLGEQ